MCDTSSTLPFSSLVMSTHNKALPSFSLSKTTLMIQNHFICNTF